MIKAKIIGTIYPKSKDDLHRPLDVLSCIVGNYRGVTYSHTTDNHQYLSGTEAGGAFYQLLADDYIFVPLFAKPRLEELLKEIEDHKDVIKELEDKVDKQMNPHGYFKKEERKWKLPSNTLNLEDNLIYNFGGKDYSMVSCDAYNSNLVVKFELLNKVQYTQKEWG
jgi:mRNA-degrading endonuclease HigB of HigAB toxin-antitoxin module